MTEFQWSQLQQDAKKASEPIAEGRHSVKVVDVTAGRSSTGKLMFTIKLEITDGPEAKRRVTTNLTLSPENGTALAIFFRNMEAIGLPGSFFDQEPSPDQIAGAMLGRQVDVMIKHGEWQGVKRGNVDRWLPSSTALGGGGPVAPGTVVGPAGPPLPTANTGPTAGPTPPQSSVPGVGAGPTIGAGPAAPDGPPALPI